MKFEVTPTRATEVQMHLVTDTWTPIAPSERSKRLAVWLRVSSFLGNQGIYALNTNILEGWVA